MIGLHDPSDIYGAGQSRQAYHSLMIDIGRSKPRKEASVRKCGCGLSTRQESGVCLSCKAFQTVGITRQEWAAIVKEELGREI